MNVFNSIDILSIGKSNLSMKNSKKLILFVLLFISTISAGAMIQFFNARSEGESVRLEWQTGKEVNLQKFVIERKTPQSAFIEINTVQPKGDNSYYTYLDESVYKITSTVYIYRLEIVDNNNQVTYTNEVSVSPNISGIKRTWGSIKAMFR